jgi:hypothetical protein
MHRALAMWLLAACSEDFFSRQICDPGVQVCVEGRIYKACNARGTAWEEGECRADEICLADACSPVFCTPGERYCGSNGIHVYTCDATGTGGCYTESCASPPLDGLCYEGNCVAVCGEGLKSYEGCEFYATDLDNATVYCSGPGSDFCDAAGQQYAVGLSNPNPGKSAHIIITSGTLPPELATAECQGEDTVPAPNNFMAAGVVPPKGFKVFKLPPRNINGTEKAKRAYRVGSNIPVTVYQFNPLDNVDVFSNDASLLMPTTTADKEYYAMTRAELDSSLRGFVTVVGVSRETTTVTVTASAKTGGGSGVPALRKGQSTTQTLERFEVLNIESNGVGEDLTGTHIVADRNVIVYAGHEAANAPIEISDCIAGKCVGTERDCTSVRDCIGDVPCCADHLEEQIYPVSAWGREYLAVRSYRRGSAEDLWRVLSSKDGTEVALAPLPAGVVVPDVLDAGEWFEFKAEDDLVISANQPILVGQFLTGQNYANAGIGDPAFMLAVPLKQLRRTYVFFAPDKYAKDYVSVAVRDDDFDAEMDGKLLSEWHADDLTLERSAFGDGWVSYRIHIADGYHSLSCPEKCSVMVHGYDQYVSYGYPGGLDLHECETDNECPPERPLCRNFTCVAGE